MSGAEYDSSASGEPAQVRVRWYRDWRVWLGIAITALAFGFSIRGVPLAEVREALAQADLPLLLGVSIPSYMGAVYARALRWRQLTASLAPMSRGVVFRAMAIGFMVNNLVPLRVGELARSWYLARETGTRVPAVFGTVVLERVIDIACVLALAGLSLVLLGDRLGDGGILAEGAQRLAPVGIAPLVGLVALRLYPEQLLSLAQWLAKPLPTRMSERLEPALRHFLDGLGALSGGRHLLWIALHSVTTWLVFSSLPVAVGLLAFDLEFNSLVELCATSWAVLALVGVAVALPSAPGFFGLYQLAFVAVLTELGFDRAVSLAIGLLVWFVFWASLTLLGLVVLRRGGTSLGELTGRTSKDPIADRR